MKKVAAAFLSVAAIFFFLTSLMFGYYSVLAFIDRSKFGPGLFFADVEIFVLLTILFTTGGFLSLWILKKIKEHLPPKS